MKPLISLIFNLLFSIILTECYKTYANYKVYEVNGERNELKTFYEEVRLHDTSVINEYKEFLVSPETQAIFNDLLIKHNLTSKITDDDFSRKIHKQQLSYKRNKGKFDWNDYYDVDDIYNWLKSQAAKYPDSASTIVGGKTYEGRQILGLKINTKKNLNGTSPKKIVFIESGIHAREWIAPATTTYFINELLTNNSDPKIQELRDRFEWHIFPTTNPDGYHYSHTTDRMWRKTRSLSPGSGQPGKPCFGADPNRNWDYEWGAHGSSIDPCNYEIYQGSKVFSEIETKSLSEYISSLKGLTAYIGFHSFGNLMLIPYSDSEKHRDNYDDLVKIGKTSLDYGEKVLQPRYHAPSTAAEIIYKVGGGSMDWVKFTHKVPLLVCTYELRGYGFLWPKERIYQQGNEVTQMMLGFFTEAKNLGYV